MAWPNFLPRDNRKEDTTCAQDKMGDATKCSTLDRSVASLEHRHSLSLPVAISLEVACYSDNLSSLCSQLQQPSECLCKMFAKLEKQAKRNQEVLHWLVSNALHIIDTKKALKLIFGFRMGGGGLFNYFPSEASGTDGMKDGAQKDVITRTLGMTACLVTWCVGSASDIQWLFFHFASQCKATNQKECLSAAHKMTNKAICLFTGCPPLTLSGTFTGTGQTQNRCWYCSWTFIILGTVCVGFCLKTTLFTTYLFFTNPSKYVTKHVVLFV